LPRLCPSVTTMSKPCCPVKKTTNAQFDTRVQLLQSQPPMQMSDCLGSTQQLAFLVFEYLMLVSLGAWMCGCPGTGFSFWSVVLRFPLHPMLDRLTHFHHWLVFLVYTKKEYIICIILYQIILKSVI
jgi:hypothetical protein